MNSMITAITSFKLRPGISRQEALNEIRETIPIYQSQPALIRKYICLDMEKQEGKGIYLWRDRGAAEAFFEKASIMIEKQTGSVPQITLLDTPVIVDNDRNEVIIEGEIQTA
jgi:hypothetical protein